MAYQYCFCFVSVFDLMAVSMPLHVAKDACEWAIDMTSHACCPHTDRWTAADDNMCECR